MPVLKQTTFNDAYLVGLAILVFVIDAVTPLGYSEWVLYVLPVAICVRQSRPQLPLLVAVALMPLLILGYFLSPPGVDTEMAIINRLFSIPPVFGVAYLARWVIEERLLAQKLMWFEHGRAEVAKHLLGEPTVGEVAENILHSLARYFDAQVAVLYRLDGDALQRTATYALDLSQAAERIPAGSGTAGEVVREGKAVVLRGLPGDFLRISSAIGSAAPAHVVVAPLMAEGHVEGVVEFGFLRQDSFENEVRLLELVANKIGSALRSALYRQNLKDLLEESQRQGEELQAQQEELRVTNEELNAQAKALQEAQAELETQHSVLEQANVQLEERNELLEQQKRNLIAAQQAVERSAAELERANRYKSEFLANMSHELRTPLNSSLILSHMLAENKTGTLTEEQVRYARTIHSANTDLLNLINDILDLSRIEAGQLLVQAEPVRLQPLLESLRQAFEPVASQKGLGFSISVSADAPAEIVTDELRLSQVVKNLLSNAFKFTETGEVELQVALAAQGRMRFAVRDTGIGIAREQQQVIFEAFRQADGSISRTYGGTGLGLSISRELARLLDGDIEVTSSPGIGSTFTLEFAARLDTEASPRATVTELPAANDVPRARLQAAEGAVAEADEARPSVQDDRGERQHERLILIVEDDDKFASVLCDLVREMHFDCLHAPTANAAIQLAQEYRPDAVLLDVHLPDYSGLSVLERLKRESSTRHIPVHMISVDDYRKTALELGAIGYTLKPVARDEVARSIKRIEERLSRRASRILIVEDNASLRDSMAAMLGAQGTDIVSVGTAEEALEQLAAVTFDCMVMDLNLPDKSGFDVLDQMAREQKYGFPPVIIYTGRVLSRDEEQRLRRYSQSIIIKGARSPERLLDEVSLFLHRVEASLPEDQQEMLLRVRQRDAAFEGRRILIAEDDIRNVYALTSIFEPLGAELVIARNGREALQRLAEHEIDLVLMDVMMPEMDGLSAIREIRRQAQHKNLPVVALTAKAMTNDRRDCLEAGANDYIAKPIDVEQLVSLCRVWMPRHSLRA
ncbi:response regulator [Noviherbaspirillum sp.]|uniref:response regulator n=1 Tax=Noviherbaspirillum sp. TaxID=1926288 RepID=UPI002D49A1FD|nr:response regulator [Noviherbaspirillum sp.]HZW20822.1 response regulator [Noviherbaspirillum sp.]